MNNYNSVDCMYIMNTLKLIYNLVIINVFIMYIQSTLLYLFIICILMIISYYYHNLLLFAKIGSRVINHIHWS